MPNKQKNTSARKDESASGGNNSHSKADILALAGANELLAAFPPADLEALAAKLKPMDFKVDIALLHSQETVEFLYFPTSGIISLLTLLEDGTTVEVAVVGTEGMVGISTILGGELGMNEALSQSEGGALKIRADDLRELFNQKPAVRETLLRYAHNLMMQVSQNAACNRAHTVEQQLARWLLLTHDRLRTAQFIFTQEFMSRMLGVRRAGVSVAANTLRQAGIINYSRGGITINDRPRLEGTACECYRAIESHLL